MRQSFPERSFPFAAVGVSPLRRGDSASPFPDDESPAGAGFWCLTLLRLMGVSLSFPFGPLLLAVRSASSRRVAFPAGALAARIASADFSLHLAVSPFQAQSEISPGKGHGFPRAAVGSTSAPLGRKGLRSSVRSPWLPAPHIHHTRFVDLERVLPVRRLAVSLPASFSADLTVGPVARLLRLAGTLEVLCDLSPQRAFTSYPCPCWAHTRSTPACRRAYCFWR